MELYELLENVDSKETFLEFLRALADDRAEEEELEKKSPSPPYGPGAKGWEHGTISSYLDAMERCVSGPANRSRFPAKAGWNTFAKILFAGKGYE